MWFILGVYLILTPINESRIASFTLHENGVTILCDDANIGDSGEINGITYTKRKANQISVDNASSSCTSGIDDFSFLFEGKTKFNEDISHWDVSDAYTFEAMFRNARSFNQDISHWDMSNAIFTTSMFEMALAFNQDISNWNVFSLCFATDMFLGAQSFNQNLNNWDTRSFIDIGRMLKDAKSFDSDLSNWKIKNVIYLNELLVGTATSPEHYSKLLISWSNQEPKRELIFNSNGLNYLPKAIEARNKLVANYAWEINDKGMKLDEFVEDFVYPEDNHAITDSKIEFLWSHVPYSTHYNLQLGKEENFSSTILDTVIFNTNELSFTLNNDDITDELHWQIQALYMNDSKISGNNNWLIRQLNAKALSTIDDLGLEEMVIGLSNYPNPFNPKTTLYFELSKLSNVKLSIYNANGHLVSHILKGTILSQGIYRYSWDATGLSSGIYFVELTANDVVRILTICLIK